MELKKTISSIFMVPTLRIDREDLRNNNFLNGYCWDIKQHVSYKNSVYVLFKPKNLDRFKEFLDGEYERTSSLIEDYDYPDGFVVLVYSLNPKYEKDFSLVKKGKYSKTSEEFQQLFPKVIKVLENGLLKDATSLQWRIFNKEESLRMHWEGKLAVDFKEDMEVWGGFDEAKETLDIDKIKELI